MFLFSLFPFKQLTCLQDEGHAVDLRLAEKEARDLHDAGEGRWGTDESRFLQIISKRSFAQLRATFAEYAKVTSIQTRGLYSV